MNQILDYDDEGNSNNYKAPKGGNYGSGKTPTSDKVVKVFAFLMIILAVALIGSGAYSLVKNKKDSSIKIEANANKSNEVKADINTEIDEENGKVIINIKSPVIISKVIYNWDQGTESVVSGENSKTLEKSIDLPSGSHSLNVQVVDVDNNKTTESIPIESSSGIDTTAPDITLEVTANKKLSIVATDDTEISFVTYRWNEEESTTVRAESEGQKEIKFELDIPKGQNTITVVAVDSSESANTKSATKNLKGVTVPEITYGLPSNDTSVIEFTCSHENGIKSIYYTFDGKDYEYQASEDNISTSISFTQASVEGINKISITVTSVDDTSYTEAFDWEYHSTDNGNTTNN